jgi:hypothetical protein
MLTHDNKHKWVVYDIVKCRMDQLAIKVSDRQIAKVLSSQASETLVCA